MTIQDRNINLHTLAQQLLTLEPEDGLGLSHYPPLFVENEPDASGEITIRKINLV